MRQKERAALLKTGLNYLEGLEELFSDAWQDGRGDLMTRIIWMHGGSADLLEQLGLLTHEESFARTASLFMRWMKETHDRT